MGADFEPMCLPCYTVHRSRTKTPKNKLHNLKSMEINTLSGKKNSLISELPVHLDQHLLGDIVLFVGQDCTVSKLRYHSHRGQRQPSCGVHSALESTSGFVCLEMRMGGGSETP